jgi:hypothetical protein
MIEHGEDFDDDPLPELTAEARQVKRLATAVLLAVAECEHDRAYHLLHDLDRHRVENLAHALAELHVMSFRADTHIDLIGDLRAELLELADG